MEKIGQHHDGQAAEDCASEPTADISLDSVALARLLEEVRNDTAFNPSAYNRTYNRHNR